MPYRFKIIGVYRISNLCNAKIYIGASRNILHRLTVHRSLLNSNRHWCSEMQKDWNAYGESNFRFDVACPCRYSEMNELEQKHIELTGSNNPLYGYNRRIESDNNFGVKATPETREKLRISHLGHKRRPETQEKISKAQYKPVVQIDMNRNVVQRFDSIKQASEFTGFCSRGISLCATKKMNSHPRNKYQWLFATELEN